MPVAVPAERRFTNEPGYTGTLPAFTRAPPGHHRRHRGLAVALPGSVWASVEQRCRPGCSRCRPGCSRCAPVDAGPSR
ncbi:hypothetical protein DPMN_193704 [Dreissena polymorpha]|uniref:Uncharacterized protein n=1 Tax=Dreissena polymorpha TaxID=45954 RepID=A0A9D4BCD3_DREPO|nr:hypothetical protein DPMN_193704 [Dreissena polymorpha]